MIKTATGCTRRHFLGCLVYTTLGYAALKFPAYSQTMKRDHGSSPEGAIEFESSDMRLLNGFRWAKAQAFKYVRNDGSIGPWYEAALPARNAFCMRDVSHMSTGAQILGLGARTRNMLRLFAEHISPSKKWCAWWEITKDGKPAPVDYKNDHDFWYDLPANFDVLDACHRQWLWSRDSGYLDDVFLNFYRRTVTDYVAEWDHDHDGIPEHLGSDGHVGIGTYDEDLQDEVLVGADLIAAQYAAYRGYAAFEGATNHADAATQFTGKAEALKSLYNDRWWDPARNRYFGALGEDGKFHPEMKESTGRSDTELPLYYELTEAGPQTQASLDYLEQQLKPDEAAMHGIVGGVEGRTYLPDIFYKYGRSHSGYAALVALMDPRLKRREYPEVSFTVIGNLGAGLMGIRPLPDAETIETHPQLTGETGWAALKHVPVGDNVISIRHEQTAKTTLINESGPDLTWRASFPGKSDVLFIDSRQVPAKTGVRLGGGSATYHTIKVRAGETYTASVHA